MQHQAVLGSLLCPDLPVAITFRCGGQGFPAVTPLTLGQDHSLLRDLPIHCKTVGSIPGPNPLNVSSDHPPPPCSVNQIGLQTSQKCPH